MSSHVIHPSDEVLEEYYFQRLNPTSVAEVEEHLLWCETCQTRLESTSRFIEVLRPALQETPKAQVRHSWWRAIPRPLLVGGLAAAICIGAFAPRLTTGGRALSEASLVTSRGAADTLTASVSAARQLRLHLDFTGLEPRVIYRVAIVASDRTTVLETTTTTSTVEVTAPLKPDLYLVRLNTADGDPLREYVLRVVP